MKPYKVVGIGLNKTGTKTSPACLRGSGAPPIFEACGLAEREKSQKFSLSAAISILSLSFRTASVLTGPADWVLPPKSRT